MGMRFALVYFTATKNSLYVANRLRGYIEADVFDMADPGFMEADLSGYEGIGVVCPVYCGGIPNFVEKIIQTKLAQYKDKYHFAILNYGDNRYNAEYVLSEVYKTAGLKLSYYNAVKMPENFVVLFKVPGKEKVENILADADQLIPNISKPIVGLKKMMPPKKKLANIFIVPFYNFSRKKWKKAAQKYNVAGCNRCSICARGCPTKNIGFRGGDIVFGENCEFCLKCINICPRGALSYGIARTNGARYMNPKVL